MDNNPNQPMGSSTMGQPAMNQPMMNSQWQPIPQPMMQPPKQPMDPAKKKKLVIGLSVGAGILVLGIVAAIVIPILLRIDYSSAYSAAKELKPKIYDLYHSYDCQYVIDYVGSSYTSTKTYNEYIEGCKKLYNSDTNELISKLENTDGVKRNSEIKDQFNRFKAEYATLSSGDSETLDAKLALYQAWHSFVVAVNELSNSSSDSESTTAANYLINSGNDTLKTYGEGWLEHRIAVAASYRAYYNTPYTTSSADKQLRDDYYNKRSEDENWRATNRPDIKTVAPLSFDDTSKMNREFTELYNLIATTYTKNYNYGSGDCTEFLGEVICE